MVALTGGTAAADVPGPWNQLTQFQSPSGNIGCEISGAYFGGGSARCDLAHNPTAWALPPKPANCHAGYGNSVGVGPSGVAQLLCISDSTIDPSAPVLPYGSTTTAYGYRCSSARSGVTCANVATGHGFVISTQSYRLF